MTIAAVRRFAPGTVDAHVHLGLDRYGPVQAYVATMGRTRLDAAVLVQHQGQTDNRYLFEALHSNPARFAVLAALATGAGPEEVRSAVQSGAVGIRVRPEIDLSGRRRRAFWGAVDDLGLIVSVIGVPHVIASPTFRAAVRALADVRFRLEHVAGIKHVESAVTSPDVRRIFELGAELNVWLMWSGFWLNAGSGWPYTRATETIRASLAAFGPERICWSGDWNRPGPPIGSHINDADYVAEADLIEGPFGVLLPADRRAILGDTARRLFGLAASAEEPRNGRVPVARAGETPSQDVVEQAD
jgi:predicted TIM-barrel fold metal-dependent hydrolase